MSRRIWAMMLGSREGARIDPVEDPPREAQITSHVSTANLGAVGDVDWTAGNPRTVLAVSALVRSPRGRSQTPAGAPAAGATRRVHRLELIGELDRISAPVLEREIERLCEEGVDAVTLDLRRVTHIDPTGVAVIAFRSWLCRKRGFEFELIPGPPRVQRAFARACLLDRLPFRNAVATPEAGVSTM